MSAVPRVVHIITHGKRTEGFDPVHTEEGKMQILALTLPDGIEKVVVGVGTRFQEIYNLIKDDPQIAGITPLHSPFCGGYDGLVVTPNGNFAAIAHGNVPINTYLGLIGTPGFSPRAFVDGLGEGTLICGGGEVLLALGYEGNPPKGALFEIDLEDFTITLVQQG